MKKILSMVSAGSLLAATLSVDASELTVPNNFRKFSRVKPVPVNQNFRSVKKAVNDNHARISQNERAIEEQGSALDDVTGTLNQAIEDSNNLAEEVNANTADIDQFSAWADDVEEDIDDLTSSANEATDLLGELRSGYVVVSGAEFKMFDLNTNESSLHCNSITEPLSTKLVLGDKQCALVANVHLPDGATVRGMDCYVTDSSFDVDWLGHLFGHSYTSNQPDIRELVEVKSSDASEGPRLIFGGRGTYPETPDEEYVVENSGYQYVIWMEPTWDFINTDAKLEISGCNIRYEYLQPAPRRGGGIAVPMPCEIGS